MEKTKFIRYEYPIIEDDGTVIIGSFTLKANAKHPEIVKQLKAKKVQEFEAIAK